MELAQRILTLHALSGGRFTCAVGSGSLPLDFVAVGVNHSKRFKMFNEGVPAIKALLDGETVGTANIHPWPDVTGKARIVIASWYNGPWIKRAAKEYAGWVASGLNSTFAELREGIRRYREADGQRAMVATVGVNFEATSPPLTDDTNFTLRCGIEEARDRVGRLAELGFDDLLLTSGTNFAAEDVPEQALRDIVSLRPSSPVTASIPATVPPSGRPRAQDPVCRRFIDLTTMTSPTSRAVFDFDDDGQKYWLCSQAAWKRSRRHPPAT